MVDEKYTKGEWKVEQRGKNCFAILGPESQVVAVADLIYQNETLSKKENLANANLIASAPDLYEALNCLMDFYLMPTDKWVKQYGAGITGKQVADKARKAIAKAEGK